MHLKDVNYVILTKRNLAIDQMEKKFIKDTYRLIVHVGQLNKKSYLWGAQVSSDQIEIITPKSITPRKSLWIL